MGSGATFVAGLKKQVDDKAAKDAENLKRITNTVEIKAAEAAAKASEPYFTSM